MCEVTIEFGLSVDGGGERVNNVFELELITFRISVLSGILTRCNKTTFSDSLPV